MKYTVFHEELEGPFQGAHQVLTVEADNPSKAAQQYASVQDFPGVATGQGPIRVVVSYDATRLAFEVSGRTETTVHYAARHVPISP